MENQITEHGYQEPDDMGTEVSIEELIEKLEQEAK